jgi:S1-C subfamily serine protease
VATLQLPAIAMPLRLFCLCLSLLLGNAAARAADLVATVAAVKPSVVGIGTSLPTRSPAVIFFGTGWVTGDGYSIITNAHVVSNAIKADQKESLGIVIAGEGNTIAFRPAAVVAVDAEHDLAHMRVTGGPPLPALRLGDSATLREGRELALTGFPLGMVLGLHHVTHRATLSAITPIIIPSIGARQLDARAITQLARPFDIFQLDGTAYPGNSGSPVYDPADGVVYAVINMGFVKGFKESAISSPSGISYAIPGRYVQALLQRTAQ